MTNFFIITALAVDFGDTVWLFIVIILIMIIIIKSNIKKNIVICFALHMVLLEMYVISHDRVRTCSFGISSITSNKKAERRAEN